MGDGWYSAFANVPEELADVLVDLLASRSGTALGVAEKASRCW